MAIFRTAIILLLVLGIFGSGAYFANELFLKPRRLDAKAQEDQLAAAALPPPADPTVAIYEKIQTVAAGGNPEAARAELDAFLKTYPDSPKAAEARHQLGEINADQFFSPLSLDGKTEYTVVSGDSLVKIASKFKTNAELIYRVNNLDTINLKIGQRLVIPQPDMSIKVDQKAGTVTLLNRGAFFKEFPTRSIKIPARSGAAKVADKVALKGSNRLAFGDKDYAATERWIMVAPGGIVIRGAPEGAEPPGGVILDAPDIDEIFVLVSRGTPVTME